ncbi:MAG: FAD-binding oxidoreductase [Hyphomicrobiales bacterium]|nr:FAD-binding oxidoreductase [Hyphomicrobiales bacterium]MDE2113726.1 FAD-binding oxidoreductase [Hyphomicrobiales bacterium]
MPTQTTLLEDLGRIVGPSQVMDGPDISSAYLEEPRGLYKGVARALVRPSTTGEVAQIARYCFERRIALIPQGGNTGLVGGQVPDATGTQIILSLTRMTRVRDCDLDANVLTIEAGATLNQVQEMAEKADRLFPLSLASEGSCTIGGNLATNAGGTAVLAYGNARDLVLGVEVVLADGRILPLLTKLKKDNTGYDLKHLFMGSEGTLGIITAASLKLFPKPRAVETAIIGLASPQKALDLLRLAQNHCGSALKTFELVPRIGIQFVLSHAPNTREPMAGIHAWYVLLELADMSESGLNARLEELMALAMESEILEDATIATSLQQRESFWGLRESLPLVQGKEGGSIKHDVSVPIAQVPYFLTRVEAAVLQAMPGARLVAFGHLGDGNIHCNVSQPIGANKAEFLSRWQEINQIVHAIVAEIGGSISAEHGIGQLKRALLREVKDPTTLAVMHAIKDLLDPHAILNPGKVL